MGTQHRCRRCKKIVCILFCSVQDPDSENENHRVHKDGDHRCSNDKSFSCSICEEQFTTKEELDAHLETPHKSFTYVRQTSGNFECPTCEQVFRIPSDLQNHIESSHDESYSSFKLLSNASSSWKNGFEETLQESLSSTLETLGIPRLPEISKRIRQNFEGLLIDKDGNIENDDSDEEYIEEPENILDKYLINTRKRKLIDDQSKSDKRQKTGTRSNSKEISTLVCDICTAAFTRKDNLARHKRNKHK